jgi:hypothetical protein
MALARGQGPRSRGIIVVAVTLHRAERGPPACSGRVASGPGDTPRICCSGLAAGDLRGDQPRAHRPRLGIGRFKPGLGDRLVPLISHAQLLQPRECQASAETPVWHQPKLYKASAEHAGRASAEAHKRGQPTAGFEPATRYFTNQDLFRPARVARCQQGRFVFGRRKFRADTYRQMLPGGHESGGILVVRSLASLPG